MKASGKTTRKHQKILRVCLAAAVLLLILFLSIILFRFFRNRRGYDVCFYSHQGALVSAQTVTHGESAAPPKDTGTLDGWVFTGWDTDFSNIMQNTDVRAVCSEISTLSNAIVVGTVYVNPDGTATVPVLLTGRVNLAGLDASISYDAESLDFVDFEFTDDDVVANCVPEEQKIYFNFISTQNIDCTVDLFTILFNVKNDSADIPLPVEITGAVELEDGAIKETDSSAVAGAVLLPSHKDD